METRVPPALPRRHLLSTSEGSSTDAFGSTEWSLAAALALIWGSSFLWMEIGLQSLSPGVISWVRVVLGAATLAVIPGARRPVDRSDWPQLILLAFVWTAIPLTLFPLAQQWIDSALAGMLNGGVPLAAALWSTLLLRRLPGRIQIVGLLVGFLGVVVISLPSMGGEASGLLGVGLVLLAVVLYGLAGNLAVPLQQRSGALPVILRTQVVAAVALAPYGILGLDDSSWAWGPVLSMLPLGIFGTGLAFAGMTTLLGRVGAARGSIVVYFTPAVAILLGVLFLNERVTALHLLGTLLVLVGAWLASRKEQLKTKSHDPAIRDIDLHTA